MRATIWAGSRLSSHLLAHRQVHPHDLTLVTSPQLKAEFEEQGIERIEAWRKGIDTVSFNPRWKNTATRNALRRQPQRRLDGLHRASWAREAHR